MVPWEEHEQGELELAHLGLGTSGGGSERKRMDFQRFSGAELVRAKNRGEVEIKTKGEVETRSGVKIPFAARDGKDKGEDKGNVREKSKDEAQEKASAAKDSEVKDKSGERFKGEAEIRDKGKDSLVAEDSEIEGKGRFEVKDKFEDRDKVEEANFRKGYREAKAWEGFEGGAVDGEGKAGEAEAREGKGRASAPGEIAGAETREETK